MHTSKKMENNFLIDLISDCLFVFVGFAGSYIGLDSLPENETLVQAITTIPQTSTIDVLIKIFTMFSLLVSSVAGFIPIIKFIKRNKNK
jgi:hypothetical protein